MSSFYLVNLIPHLLSETTLTNNGAAHGHAAAHSLGGLHALVNELIIIVRSRI